jgi:hypothetical protein
MMHFSFSLLGIMGLYMFRALLAHPQEVLHKWHLDCVCVLCQLAAPGLKFHQNFNPGVLYNLFVTDHICWCCSFICQTCIIYVIYFRRLSNIIKLGTLHQDQQIGLLNECFHVIRSTETLNLGKHSHEK